MEEKSPLCIIFSSYGTSIQTSGIAEMTNGAYIISTTYCYRLGFISQRPASSYLAQQVKAEECLTGCLSKVFGDQ